MLHYASNLETYHLQATDGEMGKVKNWYFDDKNWVIRYAAVDTRKWLPGKKVILSPSAFTGIDRENEEVKVRHDKETVKDSPDLQETEPVSSSDERALNEYYGWTPFWYGSYLWGQTSNPMVEDQMTSAEFGTTNKIDELSNEASYTLRDVDEVKNNFNVFVEEEELGEIADLLIDEQNWKIRYLVIHSTDAFEGENFLLSPDWIKSVDWTENNIYFDLKAADIKKGPSYQDKTEISRQDEKEIYKQYYKSTYWD